MHNLVKMHKGDFEALVEPCEVELWKSNGFKTEGDRRDPLDHDGDGRKGGSRPGRQSTAAKGAAKRRKS